LKHRIIQIATYSILSIFALAFADEDAVPDSSAILVPLAIERSVVEPTVNDTRVKIVSLVAPTGNRARLLLVQNVNFESIESDIVNGIYDYDDDDDDEPSVQLEDSKTPSGLGFIIPGGIMTTMGGVLLLIANFVEANSYFITASSILTACGIASFTFGMHKHHFYANMENRYAHPKRNRTTLSPTQDVAPVVIRKSRQ